MVDLGQKRIIVCIPAFNEARNIASVVTQARQYATKVIVCDDGSQDDTARIAEEAGAQVVKHGNNKGYGAAIRTLFRTAKEEDADVMITIDSDGQHNPGQIPEVIAPILDQRYDLVIGSRFLKKNDSRRVPGYRSVGIKTITKLTQMICYENITDAQSGFRAYSKNALFKIDISGNGMAVSTEILLKAKEKNLTITEVPVTITYDIGDTSTHNPLSHGLGIIASLIRFASIRHPLAFYGAPGLSFILLGVAFIPIFADQAVTRMLVFSVGMVIIGTILIGIAILLYALAITVRLRKATL